MAKRFAPQAVLRMRDNRIWSPIRQQYGRLSVAEAFIQTYHNKLWGNIEGEEYFSGEGSAAKFTTPYTDWLKCFIAEHRINTVIDLGCGDFKVGQQICSAVSLNYVGVDIVPGLIEYNQSRFGNERVRFTCADIIEEELPDGDLCLIRQVLQHLSNNQISRVLANCAKLPFLVVTDDVYCGPRMRPNLDITHGPDYRWFRRSGVFLDRAPFTMPVRVVLEIPYESDCVMRTCVIEQERKPA